MIKAIAVVICLIGFLFGSAGWMFRGLEFAQKQRVLAHARGVAEVVAQARQAYTELRGEDEPLPITFARDLCSKLTTARVRIYSPFPFPSNREGGLHDDFQLAAWDRLAEHDDLEFIVWERDVLKYAVPDYMGASCVECHNSAIDTPKSDWKVGDVRGVIEIMIPY